jgi:hypothetical protein
MSGFGAAVDGLLGACMQAFGDTVPMQFMPAAGVPQPVTAIFNQFDKISTLKDGIEEIEVHPTLGCQASQFTQLPAQNDQFQIRGVQWRAAEVVPDGLGHIKIILMLVNDAQANIPQTPPYG